MLTRIVVNTAIDELDLHLDDGDISLRDAIQAAAPDDTIEFSTNPVHALNGATINLLSSLGQIGFGKSLTIDASKLSNGLTIDASSADATPNDDDGQGIRIFNITGPTTGSGPQVTLRNLRN